MGMGTRLKRPRGRPRKLLLDVREILKAHKRMTLGDIGAAHGVTGAAVSAFLRRSGAAPLRPGRRPGVQYVQVTPA